MKKILSVTLIRYQQDVSQIRQIVFRNCKIGEKRTARDPFSPAPEAPRGLCERAEILTPRDENGKIS